MGEYINDLNDWVATIYPALEEYVTLDFVTRVDGMFTATAEQGTISVSWLCNCNDWPEVGQRWLVRVLGFDVATGIWLAQALMRSD